MPAEHFTTKIIVTETREIHSGRTAAGGTYTIWQLIATKPDGTPITMNLRAFSDMPKNQVLEVECKLFRSQQYGDSYTVERKGDSGLTLEQRVKRIEDFLSGRGEFRGSASGGSADPPAPVPTPPPPPPPAPPPATPPPMEPPPPAVPTDFDF